MLLELPFEFELSFVEGFVVFGFEILFELVLELGQELLHDAVELFLVLADFLNVHHMTLNIIAI